MFVITSLKKDIKALCGSSSYVVRQATETTPEERTVFDVAYYNDMFKTDDCVITEEPNENFVEVSK